MSEVIFNSKNFDSEQVLRISVDMLKTMPELCNYIENNEVLFTNFINSILETKTTDNLKLHFQVLMEVYTASQDPRKMARKYRLFRKVSTLEMNCPYPAICMDMKQFMASLLEMEMV